MPNPAWGPLSEYPYVGPAHNIARNIEKFLNCRMLNYAIGNLYVAGGLNYGKEGLDVKKIFFLKLADDFGFKDHGKLDIPSLPPMHVDGARIL